MKLGPKSKILIFFIIIIIVATVLFVLMLITTPKKNGTTEDNQGEESVNNDPNIITINPDGSSSFDYVAITNQDTIVAFDNVGRRLDLELSRKSWKDLGVSSDGKAVSVLGKQSEEDKFDLGVYVFAEKKFGFYTNYVEEVSGILKYIWKDSKTIVFNQGIGIDEWLHRFVYPTKTEVVKVVRNNDELISASLDGTFVLYRTEGGGLFYIVNTDGEISWVENDSEDEEGNQIKSDEIYFSEQPDKLLLRKHIEGVVETPTSFPTSFPQKVKRFEYYKTLLNQNIIVKIDPSNFANFTPVCAISEDKFLGYELDESLSQIRMFTFDIKEEVFSLLKEYVYSPKFSGFSDFSCIGSNKLLFSVVESGNTKWLSTEDDRVKEIKFLENAKEVKPIPVKE